MVEDDRQLAAVLQRTLREEGMVADAVHDGEAAVAAGVATDYDVILLDVMLPALNGVEVVRELRSRRVSSPILMLTARDAVDDRVRGLDAGADDYLVKPFAVREALARIRALTRRRLTDRTIRLVAGPIEVDAAAHEVSVLGRRVNLTAKEYSILEYFVHNQGRICTRDQVIEHVWSYEFEGDPNLIEVYVARLRRKLAAAGAADPFVTVRGVGYRFEARE